MKSLYKPPLGVQNATAVVDLTTTPDKPRSRRLPVNAFANGRNNTMTTATRQAQQALTQLSAPPTIQPSLPRASSNPKRTRLDALKKATRYLKQAQDALQYAHYELDELKSKMNDHQSSSEEDDSYEDSEEGSVSLHSSIMDNISTDTSGGPPMDDFVASEDEDVVLVEDEDMSALYGGEIDGPRTGGRQRFKLPPGFIDRHVKAAAADQQSSSSDDIDDDDYSTDEADGVSHDEEEDADQPPVKSKKPRIVAVLNHDPIESSSSDEEDKAADEKDDVIIDEKDKAPGVAAANGRKIEEDE